MGRVDSSKRGDCHTMVMGLDNASVEDNRVDSSSVVHRIDSGEWGLGESRVDNWVDSSGVVNRVDSSEWGMGESGVDNGVDKSRISLSLPLVNEMRVGRVTMVDRGPVGRHSWDSSPVRRNNRSGDSWDNIPVQRATIGVGADHSTVVDRVDSSAVHGGGVEARVEKSGISFSLSLLNFVDNFSILGNIRRLSQSLSKGSGFS